MSLLKQLFLAICLLLALAFAGSFLAGVESSREQLLSQLRSHAQDAATALGLSMTPHVDDPAMIEHMLTKLNARVREEIGEDAAPFDLGLFGTADKRERHVPTDVEHAAGTRPLKNEASTTKGRP